MHALLPPIKVILKQRISIPSASYLIKLTSENKHPERALPPPLAGEAPASALVATGRHRGPIETCHDCTLLGLLVSWYSWELGWNW